MMIAALLGTALVAGCASSPKTNFYTLSSGNPLGPVSAAPYRIAIGMVTVPDAVDRPQIVTRIGSNQLNINDFSRWAEPLKLEIPRVIAANLARELTDALISTYPQNPIPDADCRLQLDVQRFDSILDEGATIEILWTVRPAKGDAKSGRSTAHEAAGAAGYDALVSAHSRALASVSHEIALALRNARSGN
jgi:hypothetical protein